ncbi:type II toxin-antitoxin system RelE/ParE family toxin [Erysipelothrix rhusiopathiae]|uniref:type II toxin-antitoxin system RelE/ParE family toxin n=2 Tax=Erysipelothrix rhusiopathiae TaxID=1648 RepID=UPI002481745E|nr:type II toxin-antitoxin system RelE/ParE family toxin [Erysipelothrix rhusiopathiae]
MRELLFNTKTLIQDCSISDFIDKHNETLILLQKIIYEKVKVYGDFDFFSESYFCGLTINDFISKLATSTDAFSRDEITMLFSILHKIRKDERILSNISDEELSVNGNLVDPMSTESLSYNNKIHQVFFTNDRNISVEVCNLSRGKNFEVFLISEQWSYNVLSEVDLLGGKYDVSRIFFDDSMRTIAFANSFEDFDGLDKITQKEILFQIMNHWPVLIQDGGRTLGSRFVQPVSNVLSNESCYEYRLKCNEKQYRIYFTISSGITYILADYYKKTQRIPDRIKNRIRSTYRSI